MNISRFFGSTSREAMRQVRMALGPDALIVSNRRVGGGVEILAADATSTVSEPAPSPAPVASQHSPAPVSRPVGNADAGFKHALDALQGTLEGRLDELLWSHQVRGTPVALRLFQQLLASGFSITLLRALLKRLPSDLGERAAFQWVRTELETRLPLLRTEDQLWQPGLALAVVGPTGVGKTTTVAKLAARAVRRFGPEHVVLITTDTYRIGAHEQLKIYGNLLRVPVHVVQDAQQLRNVLLSLRPEQLILIDNVGISQRDQYVVEQARLLANAGRRIQRLLVLNAGSQGDTLDEVARSYSKDGGTPLLGCIISKLDEATRLGATLDTAIRFQLPVHYVSDGQKVPENLRHPSASELVTLSLQQRDHQAASFTPSQADLAALLNHDSRVDVEHLQREHERRAFLLPALLAVATPTQFGVLGVESVRQVMATLEDSLVFSEAFDLWRAAQENDLSSLPLRSQALFKAAMNEMSEQAQSHAMVVHSKQPMPISAGEQLYHCSVLSLSGQALTTPYYQMHSAASWSDSLGNHVLDLGAQGRARDTAVQAIQGFHSNTSLLHWLAHPSAAQMREYVDKGWSFLAPVSPAFKVWHAGGHTRPSAIAKELVFDAVTDLASQVQLSEFEGACLNELSLWYSSSTVYLRGRAQEDLAMQLVLLRLVRRSDGQVLKNYSVFSHQPTGKPIALASLASALLTAGLYEDSHRMLPQMHQLLLSMGIHAPSPLLTTQLCLAAASLLHSSDSAKARQLAAQLLGKPALTRALAAPALLKLLVLKEAIQ